MRASFISAGIIFIVLTLTVGCGGSISNIASVQTEDVIATNDLLINIAKDFYSAHPDEYDMLVIWTAPEFSPGTSFYLPIKNDVTGIGYKNIGDEIFDNSADYGSDRLQGIIWMGPNWITNTDDSSGPRSNLGILAQETGHRWMALVHFTDPETGSGSSALLEDTYHWNFYLNTGASPMGGNEWESLGGSLYKAEPIDRVEFCPLDLYLMGLITAEEVGSIQLLTNPRTQGSDSAPDTGKSIASARTDSEITIEADAVDITIEQVIETEGARGPDTGFTAKNIRQAWIYLYKSNDLANGTGLNDLEQLRDGWYDFFREATNGLSSMNTTLR